MSLKRKTISGVIWSFTESILVRGLSFVAMLLLARWLGPEDFGLMGMLAVFMGLGTTLVDSGLSASIIRTKNADDSDFSTVFYMNMVMGVLAYFLLFFLAPLIAAFFGHEILINLIRVYCLSFVISAFSAIQLAILNKEMRFKKIMILNAPSTIFGVVVGLFMGYYSYGVWSIVAMSLLLWFTSSWKPSFNFSKEKLAYHYKFGYKLMLSGVLNTTFNNSYHILIGKFFPVNMLGYFERAQRFNEYPAMTITGIVEKVTFPMLAELQENPIKLARIYKRLLKLTFFISAPLMLGAAALAKPLFQLVLGNEWMPAVPYFQILSVAYMLYPIHAFNLNVLKVFGRSDLFLKLEVMKKIVLAIGLGVGFQWGILGILWSMVASSFIALFINMYYSSLLIAYNTRNQLWDMLPNFLLSSLTFLIMYVTVFALTNHGINFQIFGATLMGICFYLAVHSFFKKSPLFDMIGIIKNRSL